MSEDQPAADPEDRQPGGGAAGPRAGVPGPAVHDRQGGRHGTHPQAQPGLRHEVHHAELQEARLRPRPPQRGQVSALEACVCG